MLQSQRLRGIRPYWVGHRLQPHLFTTRSTANLHWEERDTPKILMNTNCAEGLSGRHILILPTAEHLGSRDLEEDNGGIPVADTVKIETLPSLDAFIELPLQEGGRALSTRYHHDLYRMLHDLFTVF